MAAMKKYRNYPRIRIKRPIFLATLFFVLALISAFSEGLAIDRRPSTRRTASSPSSTPPGQRPSPPQRSSNSQAQNWYQRRKSGTKVARRGGGTGRKPPKWEKEGDDLYREIVLSSPSTADSNSRLSFLQQQMLLGDTITYEQARELLQNTTSWTTKTAPAASKTNHAVTETLDDAANHTEPAFLWGGLSVGPVWKNRLLQAGLQQPTPVQKDAFGILAASAPKSKQKQSAAAAVSSKKNVIIAAPTGSGKSLAFLLPLLTAGTNEKLPGMVWIVTPTNELARQLQGVVLQLMATNSAKKDSSVEEVLTLCHVLEMPATADDNASDEDEPGEKISIVSTIGQAPLLVGTPKLFLQLSKELRRDITPEDPLQQRCSELRDNLHTIVLDEADRLLQTEAVARQEHFRKELKEQSSPVESKQNKKANAQKLRRLDPTPTELLLQRLLGTRNQASIPNNSYTSTYQRQQRQPQPLRVICASATVGRTLRRQVMNLVGASSMDQAAVLVTDHIRTKKDAVARKANLLPETLTHKYYLQDRSQGKDSGATTVLDELSNMIASLPPAPMLIFPGRTGLRTLQQHLRDNSEISNVRGLEDIQLLSSTSSPSMKTDDTQACSSSWSETPIYVVSEKLGRGLDIPDIRYVVLMQVPSSAAGYTHLAGRTGRNGNLGTAISFCAPRQVPKLCFIAETLGICMEELPSVTGGLSSRTALAAEDNSVSVTSSASPIISREENNSEEVTKEAYPAKDTSWSKLSPSALKRKTIAEIKEFLNTSGVTYEKTMKKAELLEEATKCLDLP